LSWKPKMRNLDKSIRQLLVLIICLIFLASCGDSSKEAKVNKSKGSSTTETAKEVTSTEEDSKPEEEENSEAESSDSDTTDASEETAEKEAETATEDTPEPEKVAEPATEPEPETKSEPEVKASPAPEPTPEPVEVAKAEPKPEPVPEPEPVAAPEPKKEPVVEPTPPPVVETKPEPVVKPTPAPEEKPAPKVAKTSGQCPQPRKTKSAPSNIAKMDKTGGANSDNGKKLYTKTAKPMACKMCHGDLGDGAGKLGAMLKPPPRNFTCDDTMKSVTAGQMFWIIKNGSKGTGMVAHKALKDAEIWDVVKFIRADFVN
jgi:mono/diheme cytochrome c family protein